MIILTMNDNRGTENTVRPFTIDIEKSSTVIMDRKKEVFGLLQKLYQKESDFTGADERIAKSYAYLYKQPDEKALSLKEIKEQVNNGTISPARLVYASWLNAVMYVSGREEGVENMVKQMIGVMKQEGDEVLTGKFGGDLSFLAIKKGCGIDENVPVDANMAIRVGSKQMIKSMFRKGSLKGKGNLALKMIAGAKAAYSQK
jgi:hypothetical protein